MLTIDQRLFELSKEIQSGPITTRAARDVRKADAQKTPDEIRATPWLVIKTHGPRLKYAGVSYEPHEAISLEGTSRDIAMIRDGYFQSAETYVLNGEATDLRKFREDVINPIEAKRQTAKTAVTRSENEYLQAKVTLNAAVNHLEISRASLTTIESELSAVLEEVGFPEDEEEAETIPSQA